MLLLIDGGNDVDNYMKLSLAAEGIDYNGTTVEQQREQRQNYITEHAFHFLKTKECLNFSFSAVRIGTIWFSSKLSHLKGISQ